MMSSRRSTDPDFDDAELRALVQLRMLPRLSDLRLKALLSRHTPLSLVENAPHELGEAAWQALNSDAFARKADHAVRRMRQLDVGALTLGSTRYPAPLRRLEEFAPPVLFYRGRLDLFNARSIAVIGARDSTEYGDSVAEMFASELARRGVAVISGLARGIDSIAHESALAARGDTIAVLGCGIDVHYPPRNARLQERIAEEGLLISEFAPGAPALRHNFPQRNRVIALLGSGVIVVEAGPKSGTRISVDWALDYGVEVFAVPGPIGRYECQGTNGIIQDGGHLIISIRDVLERLGWNGQEAPTAESIQEVVIPSAAGRDVYAQLDAMGVHVDEIARRCGRSTPATLAELLVLEMDGLVKQYPGKRFARVLSS